MVREFLEKYQEELITEKMELDDDYEMITSRIRENEKFLELLTEKESSLFSEFSPRDVNDKNKDRIQEIHQSLQQLTQEKEVIENKISRVQDRLKECRDALIEITRPGCTPINVISAVAEDTSFEDINIAASDKENYYRDKQDKENIDDLLSQVDQADESIGSDRLIDSDKENYHNLQIDLMKISSYLVSDPRRAKIALDHVIQKYYKD